MKVVIPGGTGELGSILAEAFERTGHEVVLISRQVRGGPFRTVRWDGRNHGAWDSEIDGADVVVNLAGGSVNCPVSRPQPPGDQTSAGGDHPPGG